MLTRTIALFAFGVAAVLYGASQTDAQPGKGGKGPGKGPGAGSDVQKLERELERLLEQVQDTKAQLARARGTSDDKKGGDGKKGPFPPKGKKDFEGKKGFDKGEFMKKKGDFFKKKDGFKKEFGKGFEGMKKGFGGFGGKDRPGAKLDPETIRQKYEFYKKLYDELPREAKRSKSSVFPKGFDAKKKDPMPPMPKFPFGKGSKDGRGASRSVEQRIDAIIRELEALRNEVKGGKKK